MGTLFQILTRVRSTNSHIWGENVYKQDRFLGKFRKDLAHIGEYEKKVHFQGGKSPMVKLANRPSTYKNIIKNSILNT